MCEDSARLLLRLQSIVFNLLLQHCKTVIVRSYSHSDKELQYNAERAVISAVRGNKPNRTFDSTEFPYSDKVTKYCSIVRKVLSLVLCGSIVPHYSTKVLCHYAYNPTDKTPPSGSNITEVAVLPANSQQLTSMRCK